MGVHDRAPVWSGTLFFSRLRLGRVPRTACESLGAPLSFASCVRRRELYSSWGCRGLLAVHDAPWVMRRAPQFVISSRQG